MNKCYYIIYTYYDTLFHPDVQFAKFKAERLY